MKKNALVIGMAKSGIASAKLLCEQGYHVRISDRRTKEELGDTLCPLAGLDIEDRLGESPQDLLDGIELVVVSPAVPQYNEGIVAAKARGIEVIGEIELGYRYTRGTLVAITGTNGKTTTTALSGRMFEDAGRTTYTLGNIGVPITSRALLTKPGDVIVAEVAGFQLESTVSFRPHVCVFQNITEDHLDRFGTMEAYIASKLHIFKNQKENDFAVLNYDDARVRTFSAHTKARTLYFSRKTEVQQGAFLKDGVILFRLNGKEVRVCRADEIRIKGTHNLENALGAICAGMVMGLNEANIRRTMMTFEGVEHRIEFIKEIGGVCFINDSKATNPDSTLKAIEAMDRPTVLILGGYDKKNDFTPLFEAFTQNICAVVAIGDTKERILQAAKNTGFLEIHTADTFEEAVLKCFELAHPGYNILLSPACASYDMFTNFEQRGEIFKQIVLSIGR
ncbi:MAG: UDP-N-acetylmuramoyl-L-alanine--D-glutamate ligase [Christensenellales bacterium]|jgi:UDP-N-acetylmuramoylalanine--D-glutamate ligase